mmetsp:Transcript_63865/g.73243  ORF Transcript_63865/g.73243 Transcript_63865/m.73243 type:complete len:118 (-) Transcript_63865:1145-1498(-)
MEATLLKQLKIKTSSVKRLKKEYEAYQKEAQKQTEKIIKMKSEEEDAYSIKKQEEVLAETKSMFPHTRSMLEKAVTDLKSFFEEHGENEALVSSTEMHEAQVVSDDASSFLQELAGN